MSPRSSSASYGLRSFATLLICRYRLGSESGSGSGSGSMATTPTHHHISSSMRLPKFRHQELTISSLDSIKRPEPNMEHKDTLNVQPSNPAPPRPGIFSWVKWILGSMIPLLFSFWNKKWDKMLKLEGKVEGVVKEAEEVAEVVEKVASTTEKLSAEVAGKLDKGELKEIAVMVEHVSSVTAKDARMTQDFIHKVGDLKQDLTDLETMVEPVIDKIEHKK